MSTASPENQQLHMSDGIIHKSGPASPPELAQMTNVVSVLDLHKDFANETKIYDKNTNTVYVYSSASKIDESAASSASPELHQQLSPPQMHQVVINQHPSDLSIDNGLKNGTEQYELMQENGVMLQRIVNDHLMEGRLVQTISDGRGGEQQILTKISAGDDSLLRLIESNQLVSKLVVGENQQIIRREIVDGEHHFITRGENGEHIYTRIVNTNTMDHGKMSDEMYNAVGALPSSKGDDPKSQIIYETNGGVIKAQTQPYGDSLNPDVQKQIDLIYEDGNKTVIYTTSGNSNPDSPADGEKGMELYSSGECLGNGTQVIVQGNLQYTPQIQPDGSTVYVLSELLSSDLNGQG